MMRDQEASVGEVQKCSFRLVPKARCATMQQKYLQ